MKTFERIVGVPGVPNFGIVDADSVYRCAQPDPGGYSFLRSMGIRTVINLRAFHPDREEVEAAGMMSISYPMTAIFEIPREKIANIIEDLGKTRPALIHCAQGHDRTGAICACYRILKMGWSLDEAMEEMMAYGYNTFLVEMRETVEKICRGPHPAKNQRR